MKRKTLTLFIVLFLLSNIGFSKELPNSKQIGLEAEFNRELTNKLESDKTIIYKAFILQDYLVAKLDNPYKYQNFSYLLELINEKYKDEPNSQNYVYSMQAIELYKKLVKSAAIKSDSENGNKGKGNILKKIVIPNSIIDELDESVVSTITTLNVLAEKIQSNGNK